MFEILFTLILFIFKFISQIYCTNPIVVSHFYSILASPANAVTIFVTMLDKFINVFHLLFFQFSFEALFANIS